MSEQMLQTANEQHLLPESDKDSYAPLLVHVEPAKVKSAERKKLPKAETIKKKASSRKERQTAKKATKAGQTS